MNVWRRLTICTGVLLLGLWPAGNVLAVSVSGRSSTEIEWYDSGSGDTSLPVYEYLLLNVKDIDGKGLNFRGYGRLGMDLKNEVDADSRLYYAYLEKKGLLKNLDVKLGRQFISSTAGASLMDGIYLDYNHLGPLKLSLFGGGDVAYFNGYSARDLIDGVKLSGTFFTNLNVGLSYLQRWDHGDLANEMFGLNAEYDIAKLLNLYSEVQYDYLSKGVSYFLAGANYHRSPKWGLRAEYLYSLPVFSSTSIYSVFAVDKYQEAMGEFTYNIDTGLRAFGRYTREIYKEVSDANVFEVGIEKIRTVRCAGYLAGVWRDDADGQDLKGIKVNGSFLFNKYLQAGIGAEVDVLQRRLDDTEDDTTSSRYWADLTAYITKKINVQAKVERVDSKLWDYYNRGRVRLNILF